MQALPSDHLPPQALTTENTQEEPVAEAPPLPPDVVCNIVNALPDTRSLAMLGRISRHYHAWTLPMVQFLDPLVRHTADAAAPPPWVLTGVAGHLCRLALLRSYRQPDKAAHATIKAVLDQVSALQDARQRAIALGGDALRYVVRVADHGEDVPRYFQLVFALPPALRISVCAELLRVTPLRIKKAGELSVARGAVARDYYQAMETVFVEQLAATVDVTAKPNQPGQAQRWKALITLLPEVINRFGQVREEGRPRGEKLVLKLFDVLNPLVDRSLFPAQAMQHAALHRLFDAMLRYALRHFTKSRADGLLPGLRRQALCSGCVDDKGWRDMLNKAGQDIDRERQAIASATLASTGPAAAGQVRAAGAPVGGNGAVAANALVGARHQ